MAEMENPAEGWEYPTSLPETYQEFVRYLENDWDGPLYRIFSFRNEQSRRSISAVYDKNTQEYMLRVKIGLTEFCDIRFIHASRQSFEAILASDLLSRLDSLRQCIPEKMEYLFREKNILDWDCESELPPEINGFERFLVPRTCIQATNGSYLILDYTDFSQDSSLRFFYNIFRDDFFAEYLVLGAPQPTQFFDSKTLPELMEKVRRDLDNATTELRTRIEAARRLRSRSFAVND